MGSLAGAVELSCRRDCRLKQQGINGALEPYRAGVGQLDLQLRPVPGSVIDRGMKVAAGVA